MKLTVAMLMIAAVIYGQDANSASVGPRYDTGGHLIAYVYADGKSDHYAYDSSWRMVRFTDREGKVTIFKYGADGSMTVVNPDGSTVSR